MIKKNYFWSLFFICASTISLEVAMLRFFSAASWQSFGAMVISIALMGFGVSGTVLTIFKDFFHHETRKKISYIAILYLISLSLSFLAASYIQFNPNKMLNPSTIPGEVVNLAKYFAVFFVPFFFGGLYTGLSFIIHHEKIGKIYFFDLFGAGLGALSVIFVMYVLNPFYLVVYVFILALVATFLTLKNSEIGKKQTAVCLILVLCSISAFIFFDKSDYHIYKPASQIKLVAGNKPLLKKPIYSPVGMIEVNSNLTEKCNLPLSQEFATYVPDGILPDIYPGIYIDGNRADGLFVKSEDTRFAHYSLYNAQYLLKKNPETLLIGCGGGFNVFKAYELGAKNLTIVEPNPFMISLLKDEFSEMNGNLLNRKDQTIIVNDGRTFALREKKKYDLVEISDYAVSSRQEENYLLTVEALKDYDNLLKEKGILSVGIDVSENFFYALRLVKTVRDYISENGDNPNNRIVVIKSLFKMLILVKKGDFEKDEIDTLNKFCSDLAFDLMYYPGITGDGAIYNISQYIKIKENDNTDPMDIAPVMKMKDDQLYSLVSGIINGSEKLDNCIFDFQPARDNCPYFYSLLKPSKLNKAISTYELGGLPQQEIGSLILFSNFFNVLVSALIVVLIPFAAKFVIKRKKHFHLSPKFYLKSGTYFMCLGLGFLFIEMILIQKLALFLGDIIYSFSIVLSSILIYAGVGSYFSEKFVNNPKRCVRFASFFTVLGVLFIIFILPSLIHFFSFASFPLRIVISLIISAPVAIFLGFFFPLGLGQLKGKKSAFVPWAWSINGAFSVISSVSAKILSQIAGFNFVLIIAAILYIVAALVFPEHSEADNKE